MTTTPRTAVPYGTLDLCSNVVEGTPLSLTRAGEPVLIIGKGDVPSVGIAAPVPDGAGTRFIVEANVPRAPGVRVAVLDTTHEVIVSVGDTPVFRCRDTGDNSASVPLLDLRPLGLQLWGDEHCLYLGPVTMVRNRFRGSGIAFDF